VTPFRSVVKEVNELVGTAVKSPMRYVVLPPELSAPGTASLMLKPAVVAVDSGVKINELADTPPARVVLEKENVVPPIAHEVPSKLA
jgi:hypothetical protein